MSNKETINKRLFRAKEKLRNEQITMELPPESEIPARLDNVLHILYLLFTEGYYSRTHNQILRKELCVEAIRLGLMLTEYEKTNLPKTHALLALMCFHASRFSAREAAGGSLVLYDQQDETLWDRELIQRGMHFLHRSAQGSEVSSYHVEAHIACWHCIKEDTPEKWENILHLYDQLLLVNYSPGVVLNRAFALYKARGAAMALAEVEQLTMEHNHFYFVLLGELYRDIDSSRAKAHFQRACELAGTQTEKQEIQKKIDTLPSDAER